MKVNIGTYRKNPNINRHIKVDIDDWDTWSLDHTLALIIHPALIKFKETAQGYPADLITDESDAGFEAWKIILDKMIFAFANIIDATWEDQFHTGDIKFTTGIDADGNVVLERDIINTHVFDDKGYVEYNARIQEGLDLFSKYFRSLWD